MKTCILDWYNSINEFRVDISVFVTQRVCIMASSRYSWQDGGHGDGPDQNIQGFHGNFRLFCLYAYLLTVQIFHVWNFFFLNPSKSAESVQTT